MSTSWINFLKNKKERMTRMKRKKICIVALFLFFFCGCNAKVDVVVDTKQNMEAVSHISMFKEYIADYFSSLDEARRYYNAILSDSETKQEKYSFELFYEKNSAIGKIKKKGKLENKKLEGIETFLFKEIKQIGDSYQLLLSEKVSDHFGIELEMDIDEESLLKEIELNIQFHNVVENVNSDAYNSHTNTYTWIINKDNLSRNIEFTITNTKRYDIIMAYLVKKYMDLLFLGIFLLGISLFLVYIIRKSKRENAI